MAMPLCACDCRCLRGSEEGIRCPEAVVTGSFEPPGCWEPNLGPLQKQEVFLTIEPYFPFFRPLDLLKSKKNSGCKFLA